MARDTLVQVDVARRGDIEPIQAQERLSIDLTMLNSDHLEKIIIFYS